MIRCRWTTKHQQQEQTELHLQNSGLPEGIQARRITKMKGNYQTNHSYLWILLKNFFLTANKTSSEPTKELEVPSAMLLHFDKLKLRGGADFRRIQPGKERFWLELKRCSRRSHSKRKTWWIPKWKELKLQVVTRRFHRIRHRTELRSSHLQQQQIFNLASKCDSIWRSSNQYEDSPIK